MVLASTLVLMGTTLFVDVKSEVRVWTSSDGNYTIDARLVEFTAEGLKLHAANDRTVIVPLDKLSEKDRDYAVEVFRKQPDRPVLGIEYLRLRDMKEVFKQHVLKAPTIRGGVFVSEIIEGGPAYTAGMKKLDVLTHFDGHTIGDDPTRLTEFLMKSVVGKEYEVKLRRARDEDKGITWSSVKVRVKPIPASVVEKLKRAMEEAAMSGCPLEITHGGLNRNSIGTPELTLRVKNKRKVAVVAYEIEAQCFDRFGDKVTFIGDSNVYRGISQRTIAAGESRDATWMLALRDTTTKVIVRIIRVKMDDGEEWKDPDSKEKVTIEMKG